MVRDDVKKVPDAGFEDWWKARAGAPDRKAVLENSGSLDAMRAGPCRTVTVNDMMLCVHVVNSLADV